jgi:hypothetical protein
METTLYPGFGTAFFTERRELFAPKKHSLIPSLAFKVTEPNRDLYRYRPTLSRFLQLYFHIKEELLHPENFEQF